MRLLFLNSMVVLLLTPFPVFGTENVEKQVRELANHVDSRYAKTKDFQADFTQETRIEGFDTPLQSSGRVYIKRPGYLRWDYAKPSVEQIYVHDNQLQMYVPKHNQILKGNLTMMVAMKAPLHLLQGMGKLTEHFEVHPTDNGLVGMGGLPLLTLIPKKHGQAESSVTRIVSEIQPDTYFIRSIALHEVSGNVSTFQFTNFKANTGIDSTIFTLKPPEGVVIVEDALPQG
ncbi:MAG: outer membrane lipoprotein carrier protein LolA [Nitrospirota bacterium]|nr:outer membrane lipoprotein carrier protein LolA [Nitrospirota bacterium]